MSDHDADALVSAAGLRWLAGRPAVWSPPAMDALARRQRAGSSAWATGIAEFLRPARDKPPQFWLYPSGMPVVPSVPEVS
ncbi:hypothetical protein [Azospirillum brasilense]|uniref:hypothetical protein n=1 Tax=Azospirillum brasilense TaxID=192 RepID=UPI001585DE64|nr:hypothetical protein [Azospirillum brasilense]